MYHIALNKIRQSSLSKWHQRNSSGNLDNSLINFNTHKFYFQFIFSLANAYLDKRLTNCSHISLYLTFRSVAVVPKWRANQDSNHICWYQMMNHLQWAGSNTTNLLVIPTSTEKLIISNAYTMQAKVFHEYVISIYNNILILIWFHNAKLSL